MACVLGGSGRGKGVYIARILDLNGQPILKGGAIAGGERGIYMAVVVIGLYLEGHARGVLSIKTVLAQTHTNFR